MKNVNTYGVEMIGLDAAAQETERIREYSGNRVQITYDTETGKVYADFLVGCNNWVDYNDECMKHICFAELPMAEQEIADMIADAID